MIDQELDGRVPDTVALGTTVTSGRRGWWRSAGRRPKPPASGDGTTRAPDPRDERSTGIVELRDVASKTPAAAAAGEPRASQIACNASDAAGEAGCPASAGVVQGVPGGEATPSPRRRLRWVGWIRRRVIHDRAGL